jgi:hypothetical protein
MFPASDFFISYLGTSSRHYSVPLFLPYFSLNLPLFSVLSSSLYGLPLCFSLFFLFSFFALFDSITCTRWWPHPQRRFFTGPTSYFPRPPHIPNPIGQRPALWLSSSAHAFPYKKDYTLDPSTSPWRAWPLKMGPIGSPETSVLNKRTLRKNSKVRRIQLNRCQSLRSRCVMICTLY